MTPFQKLQLFLLVTEIRTYLAIYKPKGLVSEVVDQFLTHNPNNKASRDLIRKIVATIIFHG